MTVSETSDTPTVHAEGAAGAAEAAAVTETADAMVVAARSLLASLAAGDVPADAAEPLAGALVSMLATVEALTNALAARRSALLALAGQLVETFPASMVPLAAGTAPTARDRDHARRSLIAEVATATGSSELTTASRMEVAAVLTHGLTGVLTEMAAGRLGEAHARHLVRHAAGLPADALPGYEQDVLCRIRSDRSPARIGALARAARERSHPQPLAERHEQAAEERAVHLDPAADGMAWLGALLPAVQAHAMFDKLTGIAHTLRDAEDEQRTLAQCRADALTALVLDPAAGPVARVCADHVPADGRPRTTHAMPGGAERDPVTLAGPGGAEPDPVTPAETWGAQLDPALRALRPTVAVTVPVLTLLGISDEPGSLEGYGPIDPATARLLAAHAPSFIRLLTHPETGAVLSVGRERYTVPADLRTWLRVRDETCRFPGCRRPASRSDVDHTTPFRENGAQGTTAAANLAHLCPRHHRVKHTSRWRVEHRPDAKLEWTSPTGRRHTTEPALELPTGPNLRAGDRPTGALAAPVAPPDHPPEDHPPPPF